MTPGYAIALVCKSGLILDEDFDLIISYYSNDDEFSPNNTIYLGQTLFSGVSIAGIIFLLKCKFSKSYIICMAAPLVFVGTYHLRNRLYRRRQRQDVEILLKTVADILKLLKIILEYFKLKDSLNTDESQFTKPHQNLIEVIFSEICLYIDGYVGSIKQFGLLVPSLADYVYLEHLQLEQFNTSNVNGVKDCISYLQRLCDIFILVSSNTLTCVAISLCTNVKTKFNINTCEVFDVMVPKLKAMAKACYVKIHKEFEDVKYHNLNKSAIIKTRQELLPFKRGKIYMGATRILVYTSEILEKSDTVVRQLEKPHADSVSEKEELLVVLSQLRNQVFEYYECLDVLHKIVEIDLKNVKPSLTHLRDPLGTNSDASDKSSSIVVDGQCDESNPNPIEGSDDEEYEAYVGANDPPEEAAGFSYYEENDNREYAAVLGQELKTKLKSNSAFVAARDKRGIVDEKPKNAEALDFPSFPEYELPPLPPPPPLPPSFLLRLEAMSVPSFPLPVAVPDPLPNCDDFNVRNHIPPPPPPPPLPPIDLGPYGDGAVSSYTVVDNFLEAIRKISSQTSEEVFEDTSENEAE